jgi:DNA-binding response OmpR family regulator
MNKKARILIVDDEPINIHLLEKILGDLYNTNSADNGYDAIRQVKELRPDLILLDVMMPELGGFEVCKILKTDELFADIPILFLTAMDSIAGEVMGLELGGIDYLTKPVNFELLKLRVRNHIELKERNDLVKEQRDLLAIQKAELEMALGRVKRLEGIIPICMHCKNIRGDDASWQRLEAYISDHTDAHFSHGICPACLEEHYPNYTGRKQ